MSDEKQMTAGRAAHNHPNSLSPLAETPWDVKVYNYRKKLVQVRYREPGEDFCDSTP